ncbi:VWA domain-containing protein [Roseiconus nitratireducens]|uniref:VWA domain-containing protein n=1 Tax=Roseiconus nitratireducens TaxID=2605748 RepID=UPI001375D478|nr:VWA domain-containing protein [Roseiconus nitratireducens]
MDRATARFKRVLLGRHDVARVAAMRSIPPDFQSRLSALPIVTECLEDLVDDPVLRRAQERGLTDLPDGIAAMIDFVGTIDRPEATESLVALLDCGHLSWALASTATLGKHQHHAAVEPLASMTDSDFFRDNYGYRYTLARSLKDMEHPGAWEALAKLYDQVGGQLAHRLRQEFSDVTVDQFLGDQQRFQQWRGLVGLSPAKEVVQAAALTNAPDNKAADNEAPDQANPSRLTGEMKLQPSVDAASYLKEERHLGRSKYYGIDIYAQRMLFIIDRSGSMNTQVGSRTRLQRAKRELITALDGLDEACEFGILVFDRNVRAWREELVPATESNKREAIQFVQYLSAGSSTNTHAALCRGLNFDAQMEAIFLLTDGKPTYGQLVQPAAILTDVLRRNESRHVTVNTIAIAVEPLMQGFLRNLAEPSGGEFRVVN